LLKICSQLEEERDAAEEALKKGNVNTSTVWSAYRNTRKL
jgi:hypothetical protein